MTQLGLEPRHYRAIEFLQSYGKLHYKGMNRDQTIEMLDTDPDHVIVGKTNAPQAPVLMMTKKELLQKSKELAQERFKGTM